MTNTTTDTGIATPGSDDAVALGCQCPRLDNAYGKGALGGTFLDLDGKPIFWIAATCPLHGTAAPDAARGE